MLSENNKNRIIKASNVIFITLGVLMCLFIIILSNVQNIEIENARAKKDVEVVKEISRQVLQDDSAPVGKVIEYSFVLKEEHEYDSCLAFYIIHQNVEVYINDKQVYKLEASDELKIVSTPGTNWVHIPLYQDDIGKEIRIKLIPVYKNVDDPEVEFLIGSEIQIITKAINKSLPILMISGLAIIMGVIFFALSIYLMAKDKKMNEIFPLGIFSVLLGLWRFTDANASPYLNMDEPVLMFYLSVLSLTVGVIPFAKAIKSRLRLDILDIYCLFVGVVDIVVIFGNLLGLIELRNVLSILQGLLVTGIILVAVNLIKVHDIKNTKPGDEIERIAFWILISGMLVDGIIFFSTGTSENLLFILVAFLVAILTKGISIVYVYLRNETMLIEREKQLVNSRATAMMGQIRSHFVFNILNAISGMCKYDPEKADETVVRFSKYLRANVDIMQNDEPVRFELVRERLEDYVALEQVRFGDKIKFEEDIQVTDFKLPALIIQPIVENAIKHGIQPKEGPGTIILKTYEEDDNIIIKIVDDGVGYDTNTIAREGSAGMKNVQFRLNYFLKANMQINSVPGEGTEVIITLPRKEAGLCI